MSSYQGTVNWTQIKSAGKHFALVRISDGLKSIDSRFSTNWPAMKAAGVVRGSYQFFRPSQDPAAQAQLLIDKSTAAGGLKAEDLPPVLDLESADGLASSRRAAESARTVAANSTKSESHASHRGTKLEYLVASQSARGVSNKLIGYAFARIAGELAHTLMTEKSEWVLSSIRRDLTEIISLAVAWKSPARFG